MIEVAYPRQVVFVTVRGIADIFGRKLEKDNVFAVAWHAPLSFEPLCYGISVGKSRLSMKLIRESKMFCVNFISASWEKTCLLVGRESGMHQDKFKVAGLRTEPCDTIDCLRLPDALGYLECELVKEVDVGDHVFFIGRVSKQKILKKGRRLYQVKGDKFTTTR